MTAEEYVKHWTKNGDKVMPIKRNTLNKFQLQPGTKRYLEAGLPESAAPLLGFYDDFGSSINIATLEDYYDFDVEPNKYVVIGSDGGGNPIAINFQQNDIIEWLDREDNFEAKYCNVSIKHLVTFLIIYRDFITEVRDDIGEDAFFDEHFTDEQYQTLQQKLTMVDSDAITKDGFWKWELQNLIANREYYRTNS